MLRKALWSTIVTVARNLFITPSRPPHPSYRLYNNPPALCIIPLRSSPTISASPPPPSPPQPSQWFPPCAPPSHSSPAAPSRLPSSAEKSHKRHSRMCRIGNRSALSAAGRLLPSSTVGERGRERGTERDYRHHRHTYVADAMIIFSPLSLFSPLLLLLLLLIGRPGGGDLC